jgi:hypothetical protein
LGGGGAIVAAWLGAKALAEQTRVDAEALAQQTADTFAGQAEQEAARLRRQEVALANALAGELKALRHQGGVIRKALETVVTNERPILGSTMGLLQFGDPLILRSVASQLGSLEPTVVESVVELGHFVLNWNNDRERLLDNTAPFGDVTAFITTLRDTDTKLSDAITALEKLTTDRPR